MKPKGNSLELVIVCALFLLLSVGGIVWDITSGLLMSGIDGIMLIAVCLLTAVIFGVMLLLQLQKAGFLPSFAVKSKATPGPAPAATAKQATAPASPAGSTPPKAAQPARETTAQTK